MRAYKKAVRRRRILFLGTIVVAALVLQVAGVHPAVAQVPELTAHKISGDGDLDPDARLWSRAQPVAMPLSAQQGVWPFGGGSVSMVEVRAVHTDTDLFIKLSWDDETLDVEPFGVDQFVDAAAIEFPAEARSSVPAICMGQADGGVNIWHWQGGMSEGRPQTIEELSEHGYVDRYPSTDDLYFPAREAGNPVAAPLLMSDLVAVGFGTLSPSSAQNVQGRSEWSDGRWEVVFSRGLSDASIDQIDLGQAPSVDMAIAVWDGSRGERDGRKSVSQFVLLNVSPEGPPQQGLVVIAALALGVVIVGALMLQQTTGRRSVPQSDL
jgi:hypothetical protein